MVSVSKAGTKEKQNKFHEAMLRRVSDFNEALKSPAKRIGSDRPKQNIHVVDVGNTPASTTLHVVEGDEEAQEMIEAWGPTAQLIKVEPEKRGEDEDAKI